VLILGTQEGVTVQQSFAELRKAPFGFDLGKGQVYIDHTNLQPDPEYTLSRFDRLCGEIRNVVATSYNWIFFPMLAFGLIAFLVSVVVFRKRAIWNVCFVMTLISWGLAFERTTLLILVDSVSFPALSFHYIAPAYFLLVSGAVLSVAALLQLWVGRHPLQDAATPAIRKSPKLIRHPI
jgi:hypothetical protein